MPEDLAELLARLAADRPADAEPPVDTAARITAAALELFAERSYEGATTQAIAKRAGVTEKTLFKHFGSKDRLFARTVYPALIRLLEPIAVREFRQVAATPRGTFRETLRAIVADRVAFARKHPAIVKMLAQELMLRPAFREAVVPFFRAHVLPAVLPVFERAKANGEIRDLPPEVALRTVVSVVVGYVAFSTVVAPEVPHDDAVEVERLTDLILHGLAADRDDRLPGV